jgi:hypothetical protein
LRAGIQIVRGDYGGRLIEQTKHDLRTPGQRSRALGAMCCLLRYYPAGAMTIVSDGLRRLSSGLFRNLPPDPGRQRG